MQDQRHVRRHGGHHGAGPASGPPGVAGDASSTRPRSPYRWPDSRSQEPSVISRFRVKDDGTIDPTDKGTVKAITINRNFQVDNVFVVSMYYYNVVNMHETGTHLVCNFKGAHAVALYCHAAANPGKRVAPSDDWSSTGSSQAKALFQGLQS
ncbi:hypothetical protein MRX96_007907 [Rhipicephalus microplus]